MAFVTLLNSEPNQAELMVGASGSIMGLVGATGALMLSAWRRHKAVTAKRRLGAMLLIVLMQTAFDFMVPHISMIGHLSGALLGFAIALLLRDRLGAPLRRPTEPDAPAR